MITSELNAFWKDREVKIWVVTLTSTGRVLKTDTLIVRAKTKQGAFKCAINNSITFASKKCRCSARYADPERDLHCVRRELTTAS